MTSYLVSDKTGVYETSIIGEGSVKTASQQPSAVHRKTQRVSSSAILHLFGENHYLTSGLMAYK